MRNAVLYNSLPYLPLSSSRVEPAAFNQEPTGNNSLISRLGNVVEVYSLTPSLPLTSPRFNMPDSLSQLSLALYFVDILTLRVFAQQNVILSSTNPDIIYNPPPCSPSFIITGCVSPWQLSNDTVPGTTIVSTNGPIPEAGNVVPQMFLSFRASTLYLRTTSLSNATVNLTLTAEPTDVSITTQLNTSISLIVVINLPETQTTTLGVTFLPGDLPTRFDVESITLTVANARYEVPYACLTQTNEQHITLFP
ncbi:hypothetical protein BS17DRAFT_780574 [Gyrodon lividus]|nr:hypothetical protein BS17DRAFT_780574 [Gyrodon lividus]